MKNSIACGISRVQGKFLPRISRMNTDSFVEGGFYETR